MAQRRTDICGKKAAPGRSGGIWVDAVAGAKAGYGKPVARSYFEHYDFVSQFEGAERIADAVTGVHEVAVITFEDAGYRAGPVSQVTRQPGVVAGRDIGDAHGVPDSELRVRGIAARAVTAT